LEVQRFILEPVHTGSQTDPLQDSITNQKDEKQQQEQQQQQQDQEKESTNSTSQQQEENENHATDSQHPTQEENTKEKNNQKNKNTLVRVVLPCLIIVFGVCIIWKKIMDRRRQYAGRWIVGSQDPDDDDGFDDDPNETYNTRSFAGMNHT
jgi:DNA mismatch repair ATPase MutL